MNSGTESERRRRTVASLELGVLLALVGGFLDAYSFISLGGVFANAQTGNVVLFGVEAARGHWGAAVRHIPPILAFMIGVGVAETLRRPRVAAVVRWPARAALVLEILVLAAVGFLSSVVPQSVLVVVIAFVASVQVSTFRTLINWTYNTTMTTGNLRSAAQALYLVVADRDPEAARKARSFGTVILSFLVGGFAGGLLTLRIGACSIWICAAVLLLALGLFVVDEHREVWGRRLSMPRRPLTRRRR
ncbi:YoaK family protein [Actinoallomurus sp. CA-150999]|uniref:YoaK family protein n=1 Tax=Actinoallomurus sp. CA-150999 TaxID=3239887 RepID=UPI003D910BC6